MRRTPRLLLAAALAGCVAVEPAPESRGAVKPGQRLVVMIYQSPGPWIVADPDNKAETAIKLLPIGAFLQSMQEDKINDLSKEIQPYLPRPRYDSALEAALIAALKSGHDGPVQTAAEAGISPRQRKDWNAASDQLDWRRRYFAVDAGRAAPRDYSKLLSLDDAAIVEVNLSFGLEPDDDERTLPILTAATRLYRADTSRLLWSREDRLSDTTSSATLSEFRAEPSDLTDRLYALSIPLGNAIAAGLVQSLGLVPPPPPPPPAAAAVPIDAVAPPPSGAPVSVDASTPPVLAAPAAVDASTPPVSAAPDAAPAPTPP